MTTEADRLRRTEVELADFIGTELLDEPVDADPLEAGVVDSLGIEQLVEHIEQTFGVAIADEEMVRANFESIGALAGLIVEKLRTEVS